MKKFVWTYTTNRKIWVDDYNYDRVRFINWSDDGKQIRARINGKVTTMARYLKNIKDPNFVVDHWDGNRYNNLDSNLRVCTQAENACNKKASAIKNNNSKFLGTSWEARRRKWEARIEKNGKRIWLGYFDSEEEAAKAYDIAAKKLHGKFARLNFPCQPSLAMGTLTG